VLKSENVRHEKVTLMFGNKKLFFDGREQEIVTKSVCGLLDLKKIGPTKKLVKKN